MRRPRLTTVALVVTVLLAMWAAWLWFGPFRGLNAQGQPVRCSPLVAYIGTPVTDADALAPSPSCLSQAQDRFPPARQACWYVGYALVGTALMWRAGWRRAEGGATPSHGTRLPGTT